MARRLERRCFPPLDNAPKIEGQAGEVYRLLLRAIGLGDERLSYEANDWLMRTMSRECRRCDVTAVHAYEDCSLWQFQEAKRFGKPCIYDMPIGYYDAWKVVEAELIRRFEDWIPRGGLPASRYVRPDQKRKEMELADLVLAPSSFVEQTIRISYPDKVIARARYGVDLDFWTAPAVRLENRPLRFIAAGQLSLRKGLPLLLAAWEDARLVDAELHLVGSWQLAESKRRSLPDGVTCFLSCSAVELRDRFQLADVLVFPSFFEGFGLVVLEAMACGLSVITTEATVGRDVLDNSCGRVLQTGDQHALTESLRWFSNNRGELPAMGVAARSKSEQFTWGSYRRSVTEAVARIR
jgi:glycosyltransferase involved in cell wall biosynthesis